jgi:monoamine oxidase
MRTIIVGAGIAGLWLAEQLQKRGDTVIVLEKSDYVGGRILTSAHGYEIGAGRIATDHKRTMALIKRFNLDTFSLDGQGEWKALGDKESTPNTFSETWTPIASLFSKMEGTGRYTLRELATKILGPLMTESLLVRFGYRAEVDTLRADLGIHSFQNEMNSKTSFVVVKGGLSQITAGLAKGLDIHLNTTVQDVTKVNDVFHVKTPKKTYECDRVILALPVNALRALPCLKGFRTLDYLQMEPLTRIYAQTVGPWTLTKHRLITDSPLRYIIPVSPEQGLMMISYMESQDTKHWAGLKGRALMTALQSELSRLFPNEPIPKFRWARAYEWSAGCTYWLPGSYDPLTESKKALQVAPGLHLCNESFSLRQAWVEGALEHAAALLTLLDTAEP